MITNNLFTLSNHICPKCRVLMCQVNQLVQCEGCGHYLVIKRPADVREMAGMAMSMDLKRIIKPI